GLKVGDTATEEHLQIIRKGIGRPGASSQSSEAEQRLQPHRQRIQAWLNDDRLLLTKVHELLGREGIVSSYAALYRFARKWCEFGRSSTTIRRQESAPGERKAATWRISTRCFCWRSFARPERIRGSSGLRCSRVIGSIRCAVIS